MMHAITYSEAEQGTEQWRKDRNGGIGGSDAAAALGLSKYKTPLSLFREKRGEEDGEAENWNMARGKALEPLIRQAYANHTGETVLMPKGILAHPTYKHMLFSPDGITESGRLFEAKTSAHGAGWGEEGSDEIPQEYAIQVQHGLIVTGLSVADIAVSIAGNKPLIYHVHDDAELQEMIIEGEHEFWKNVQAGNEPEPVSMDEMVERYRLARAGDILATEEMLSLYGQLKTVRDSIKDSEEQEAGLKAAIMGFLGEMGGDALVHNGKALVTWKERKGAARLDGTALKKAHPDIAAQFTVTGEAGRTFLVK